MLMNSDLPLLRKDRKPLPNGWLSSSALRRSCASRRSSSSLCSWAALAAFSCSIPPLAGSRLMAGGSKASFLAAALFAAAEDGGEDGGEDDGEDDERQG